MSEHSSSILLWLSALGDLFSIAAFLLGLFALRQWRTIKKADAAEASLALLDQLDGAFKFVRSQMYLPREFGLPSEERRRRISDVLVQRWSDRKSTTTNEAFRVGRLCEMRLGPDGPKAYELFQRLRRHCDEADNAAFALGLSGALMTEESLWSIAVRDEANDPLQVRFDQDAQELKRLLERYLPTLKRRRV